MHARNIGEEGAPADRLLVHTRTGAQLLGFTDQFEFQKLEVGQVVEGAGSVSAKADGAQEEAMLAKVDFRAHFCQKGSVNLMVLCESSTFRYFGGKWLYSQGDVKYERQ